MVSGFLTSPCDQSRIFWGAASLIRIASNVMGFACRSRMPHRSLVGLSSLIRLPKGRSVSIQLSPCSGGRVHGSHRGWAERDGRGSATRVHGAGDGSSRLLAVLHDELHVEGQALQLV